MPNRSAAVILAAALAGSLAACTHTVPAESSTLHKDVSPMTQADTYRPHEISEFPKYTPEEVGRRFLKLADALKSFDQLSLDFVRSTTGLPFAYAPHADNHAFGMHLPDSGWYYVMSYYESAGGKIKNVVLRFSNRSERADMAPVCTLDSKAYRDAATAMGYVAEEPVHDEIGRLLELQYLRNDVRIHISERREADSPESKLRHACVSMVSLQYAGA